MNVARLCAFKYYRKRRALFGAYKVLLNSRNRQKRRNCNVVFINAAVGKYEYVSALFVSAVTLHKQVVERALKRRVCVIKQGNRFHLKAGAVYSLYFYKLGRGYYRVR